MNKWENPPVGVRDVVGNYTDAYSLDSRHINYAIMRAKSDCPPEKLARVLEFFQHLKDYQDFIKNTPLAKAMKES